MKDASSPAAPARGHGLLGRAGPLVLARLATAGLTFAIPLVLARVLSKAELGTYYQLFLVATTLYYVLPFGVVQSLYFFVPRASAPRPFLVHALAWVGGAGALGAVGLWALAPWLAPWLNNPALLEFRLSLALYTAFLLASFPLEVSLTSQGKTRAAALVYLGSDALRAAVMVLPPLLGLGLHGLMWTVVAFAAARTVAAWTVSLRGAPGPLWDGARWREQLAYATPFGAAMLLAIPQQNAHFYVVAGAVAPALYALYRVGCFQLPVVDLLYTPTSEVLMVRLGELERQGQLELGLDAFREAAARLAYAFLPLAAFLFAAAPEFIGTLFGASFLPAVPIFRVSVLGVVLAILPMDGVLRARGETRALFRSYLVKALATVPLVFLGVRHLGMQGGILAWAGAEVLGKATLLWRVPRALSTPGRALRVRDVVPWGALARAGACAAAAALGVVALRALTHDALGALPDGLWRRVVPLAAAGLLFGAGYLVALGAAGVRPVRTLAALVPRRRG